MPRRLREAATGLGEMRMGTSERSGDIAITCTPELVQAVGSSAPGLPEAGRRDARLIGRWAVVARGAVLPLGDGIALTAAMLLTGQGWPAMGYPVAVLAVLHIFGRHRLRICMRVSDDMPRFAAAVALPLVLLVPWADSLGPLLRVGGVALALLVAMRAGSYASLRAAYRIGWLTDRALIVGTGKVGLELGELLLEHLDLGLRPVGLIGDGTTAPGSSLPVLGEPSQTIDVAEQYGVRRIIVSFPADSDENLVSVLRARSALSVGLYVVSPMYELASAIPAGCMDDVRGIPLLPLRRPGLQLPGRVAKRAFDLIVGTTLLLALAPVLLLLVVAGFLFCGRPVIFRQERVTCSGRVMKIMKLRTISCPDPDSQWTVSVETCSSMGRWLRATHLDELPQLFNVIRGDMSLVGPRPERPYFTSRFAQVVPHYDDRHRTRTGMTGWAQVHGLTGDTSIPERVRFDNHYIEHWSVWLDVVIMARTIAEPLIGALKARRPATRPQRSRP
ncbi:MAG TPA: exopolysaccharide biosynthesis polyprenyl glycosylphosphotransferase [Streptosporangiaceae bacterium]|nr:exopolysaccharide biosynthesis polyprenyl glycosylphosphotransferase [Streptosporangiaceae bacterium]